jgi:hypothetical protein
MENMENEDLEEETEIETDNENKFTEQSTIEHDTIMNSLQSLHEKMDNYDELGELDMNDMENMDDMDDMENMDDENDMENMDDENDMENMDDENDMENMENENVTQMTDKCNIELSDDMARCYLNRHMDLQEMFGFNLKKAKEHWKTQGCLENRSYACKGKSEVVNETSETSQVDERITYVGPNGNKLYVYEGENGKVIEGPNGTRYVVSTSSDTTIDDIINNESSRVSGIKITKYTGEDGKEMIVIKRPDGSTIIVGPNGEIANIDTSFQNNPVRMYGHDKYILKTQVVPPVCPGCPGLDPTVYANENAENVIENREEIVENRQQMAQNAIENRQEMAQNAIENRQEIAQNAIENRQQMAQNVVDNRQQMAQNAMQNTPPQTREQTGTMNNNMEFRPEQGELLGNNLDSYEPQSMLTDFSNFAH